jgi:predicted dehydrogenase
MGKMGRIRYDALVKHGGFAIVSICDINVSSLHEEYKGQKFTSWKDCIDNSNIEAVFVCTYNSTISEIVCYAIEHHVHVFSEKPPGRNLSDTMQMKDIHDKFPKTVLKFGFNHRYHNSVIEAKALVDSGLIGEIVCARGVYGKTGSENFTSEWRNNKELSGGGILLDQGIHMLDLLCFFMGDFVNVQSSVHHLVWKEMSTEDSAFAILETAKGQVASLHSSAVQWKHKFNLDLVCVSGYISLNGIITSTHSYGGETISYYKKDLIGSTGKLGNPLEHTMCFDIDESWDLEVDEFYDAIIGKSEIIHGTVEQAAYVMGIIERIYERNRI